ncbi:hypothetical protein MCG01_02660 [Enterococcus hirae]|nr:hypothetical protein [Enterococcus hirae]
MKKVILKGLILTTYMVMTCSMIIIGEVAFASENTMAGTEEVIAEPTNNIQYDMSGLMIYSSASTLNFSEYVYMQNKPHGSSRWIPSLTKIWQVKYKDGKKYQGYVKWTGKYKNGTHIGAYYQYTGVLTL